VTATLTHIFRHPIKSIGVEEMENAPLRTGRVLPLDRTFAVTHEGAKFTGAPAHWQSKSNFIRGVAGPELMAVTARCHDGQITLSHPRQPDLTIDPACDGPLLIDWLRPLWPANRPDPIALVPAPGHGLTDVPQPYLSIGSLSTLRALSDRVGTDLSQHRFRANLWIDGWPPLHERDLIGKHIRIGDALLKVAEPITRCRATCANPETGAVDAEVPDALDAAWQHQDFGIYAAVVEPGQITRGDAVKEA